MLYDSGDKEDQPKPTLLSEKLECYLTKFKKQGMVTEQASIIVMQLGVRLCIIQAIASLHIHHPYLLVSQNCYKPQENHQVALPLEQNYLQLGNILS